MTIPGRPPFQKARKTTASVDAAVVALKSAIIAADVWVLHEIDPQALLHRGGIEIGPARQLLFFHPRFMKRLLDAEPAAGLEAPLKFLVLPEGPDVVVRWYDPLQSFSRYGVPALSALGVELSALCEQIAEAACTDQPQDRQLSEQS